VARVALKSFRGSGLGVDHISFSWVASLEKNGLPSLVDFLISSAEHLAFPLQAFIVLVHLIVKKLGGRRPVSLLSFLYRLLLKFLASKAPLESESTFVQFSSCERLGLGRRVCSQSCPVEASDHVLSPMEASPSYLAFVG